MNDNDPSRGVAPQPDSPPRSLTRNRRRLEDTPEGCRALAEADRRRAAALTGAHVRERHEQSAAAWTARADLLDRLEASFQARHRGESS